jgi:hypothetical protein
VNVREAIPFVRVPPLDHLALSAEVLNGAVAMCTLAPSDAVAVPVTAAPKPRPAKPTEEGVDVTLRKPFAFPKMAPPETA